MARASQDAVSNDLAVKIDNLTRSFGNFVAVDGISLEVPKGQIFGFLGPNGAGKSTTIRMLCGLLLPTSGTGMVAGWDIVTGTERIKQSIGYMSQRFSLYDDLTVEENISFFNGLYGVPDELRQSRRDLVLSLAGLQSRRQALTGTLPVGFKQRLALGCAILHEPPILFLDEPTSGVDPVSRRGFWDLIGGMARSGITVFVTTHYLDEADYCDRLALIYRGKIIAEGSPQELRRDHMKGEVLELEAEPLLDAVEILAEAGIDAAVFGSRIHAIVDRASEAAPRIRALFTQKNIRAGIMERIPPSLEDVFVTMIASS
jgi:ABC-2 type transport system ATP-binding protein